MTIQVYVVEDHPLMREMLREYIGARPGMGICGMAADARVTADEICATEPDLVLLDLSLPGRSGLDLMTEIRGTSDVPCVILSGHGERHHVAQALAAGAKGYVVKGRPAEIGRAIETALKGEVFVSAARGGRSDDRRGSVPV